MSWIGNIPEDVMDVIVIGQGSSVIGHLRDVDMSLCDRAASERWYGR